MKRKLRLRFRIRLRLSIWGRRWKQELKNWCFPYLLYFFTHYFTVIFIFVACRGWRAVPSSLEVHECVQLRGTQRMEKLQTSHIQIKHNSLLGDTTLNVLHFIYIVLYCAKDKRKECCKIEMKGNKIEFKK